MRMRGLFFTGREIEERDIDVYVPESRRRDILFKAGTVKELSQFEEKIGRDMYRAALSIVTILDKVYGADRDVDNGDGGFVLIANNVQDIADIGQRYVKLDDNRHEIVDVVKCENKTYINAFFLCNNEFGINVLMRTGLAVILTMFIEVFLTLDWRFGFNIVY